MTFLSFLLLQLLVPVAYGAASQTFSWSILDIKLPQPLSDMTATVSPDGLVYIAGGCNATLGNVFITVNETSGFDCLESSDALYLFDPSTQSFSTLPSLPRPRSRHAAAISNNHLWLIGGRTVQHEIIMEIDIFNLDTQTWSTPGNHSLDTSDNAAFAHGDMHVYVVGGWTTEYMARSNVVRIDATVTTDPLVMEEVAPLQTARGDIKAVVQNGMAYVGGGYTDANNYCPALASVEQYDMNSNSWTFLADLQSPRGDKALVALQGMLIALGGEAVVDPTCSVSNADPGEATVAVDDVEVLEENGNWETVASIPNAKLRLDAVAVGDTIYAFGGQNSYDASCECYTTSDEILTVNPDPVNDNQSPTNAPNDKSGTASKYYFGAASMTISIVMIVVGLF